MIYVYSCDTVRNARTTKRNINIQYNIRLWQRNDIGGCLPFQIRGVELLRRFDQKTDSADEDAYHFSEDDNLGTTWKKGTPTFSAENRRIVTKRRILCVGSYVKDGESSYVSVKDGEGQDDGEGDAEPDDPIIWGIFAKTTPRSRSSGVDLYLYPTREIFFYKFTINRCIIYVFNTY